MNDQLLIAWYRRRYTPEEIKKMQSALNKQSLGKQIAVDGIVGKETIDAVKQFQTQHQDSLKVDGMIGDKTSSALGITGLGYSNLPATRKGLNQARTLSTGRINGVSDAENARMRKYYTSPEMVKWLLNASNTYDPNYYNHYQNALNYVSPEIASRLRYINNEGDEYDTDTSKQHNEAVKRNQGILQLKQAIKTGHIKTGDDYDRWMTQHRLSAEEMQEAMADPEVALAMNVAGVISDNGRVMSQKSQAARFLKDVTNAIDEAGQKYALPVMTSLAFGPGAFPYASGSKVMGDLVVNNAVKAASDGKYNTWGQAASGIAGVENPYLQYALEYTNPGYWMMPGAGLAMRTLSYGPRTIKITEPNPNAGKVTNVSSYTRTVGAKPGYTVYEGPGSRWDFPGQSGTVLTVSGYPRTAGPTRTRKITIPGGTWKNEVEPGIGIYNGLLLNGSRQAPVLEVPELNTDVTYAPYLGYNRTEAKKNGGTLNYLDYSK